MNTQNKHGVTNFNKVMKSECNKFESDEMAGTLYKYRSWDNKFHRAILIHNQIYLPSIEELNDPFDFQLNFNFSLLDTDEKINEYLNLMYQGYRNNNELTPDDLIVLQNIITRNKSLIKTNPTEFANKYMQYVLANNKKHFGILCLSKSWNNILMWSHYSENHTGFCVGFNKKKLIELNHFECGTVIYTRKYPLIDPLKHKKMSFEESIKESFTKSIDWKYEKEFRLSKIWYPEIPTKAERLYQFDDDIIDEVIIGLEMSSNNEKEIREICRRKNIPVFKIKKVDYKFTLDRY